MPYRALILTLLTLAAALLAVGLWAKSIQPIVAAVRRDSEVAATQIARTTPPATQGVAATAHGEKTLPPAQGLRLLVKGTLLLSFVLICMLIVVGFFASVREWARYQGRAREKPEKTPYVDAWKLAGERLKEKEKDEPEEGEEK